MRWSSKYNLECCVCYNTKSVTGPVKKIGRKKSYLKLRPILAKKPKSHTLAINKFMLEIRKPLTITAIKF